VSTDVVGRTVNSIGVSSADHVFIGTSYYGVLVDNGLFRSTNFGNTWPPCGLSQALTVYSLTAVAEGEIVAGTEENDKQKGGVHYSGKDGTTWTLSRFDSIVFAVATNKAGEIIAGTKGGGVFHSTNQGGTWVPRHPGVNADIRALAVGPKGSWFAGTTDGIMRTTNNGLSWTAVNTGLTSPFVRALVVNNAGTLYAGTSGGVFQSTDNGAKWTDYNSGLDITNILSLAIDSSGYLLAGVRAGGVWRSTEATVGVHDVASIVPDEFSLDQNYPNPFNPSTTIRYGLPHRSHVTMTVFNMLGQQIGLLQNGEQEAGYHDLMFDASGLPSGVYLYRIEVRPLDSGVGRDSRSGAGSYVEAKKLLLVR
jgi:ligand-binding sensor domain-containing protein